ncbi:MAG: hypothetical protein ACM3PU_18175 [Gemmatimonadota bacterium]
MSVIVAACGGGGGGSDGQGAPTTYPLWQAWVSSVSKAETRSFSVSGTYGAASVSGSGTATFNPLAAATFEGKSALGQTIVVSGSVTVSGQTVPYGGTSTNYVDSNYMPLGVANAGYLVASSTPTIPQTAQVNDTGPIVTFTAYDSGAKTTVLGSESIAYSLLPDTSSTAILQLIVTDRTTTGALIGTTIASYRIGLDGALTRLSEQYQDGSGSITLTYQ